MNDPHEAPTARFEAEADVREHAWVGMFPNGVEATAPPTLRPFGEQVVLGACQRVRRELGTEIGPQPVRFTDKELRFAIATVEAVEYGESVELDGIINKLRHREKTMRNARSRDKRRD